MATDTVIPEVLLRMRQFTQMNKFKKNALKVRQGDHARNDQSAPALACYCSKRRVSQQSVASFSFLHVLILKRCTECVLPFCCAQVFASSLPSNDLVGLREMFRAIDTDNSGTITVEELHEGLKKKGSAVAPEVRF